MPLNCEVCESPSASSMHFGGRTCKACAAFFRRTVSMNMSYLCAGGDEKCRIHFEMRNICRLCRYVRCIHVGMKPDLVQSKRRDARLVKRTHRRHSHCRDSLIRETRASSSDWADDISQSSPVNSLLPYNERIPVTDVVEHYVKLETALNDRRRIMYTDVKMRNLYVDQCEVPYEEHELRQFDYRKFHGLARHDFIMLYDYFNGFSDFDELNMQDKNVFFRYACALDPMITSAYFTYRLGRHTKRLVMFNGEFVQMDPLPIRGDEPGAEVLFKCKRDYDKYRSLMPTKINQWTNMCVPFCELHASFEEYVLLKALTMWHLVFYKLSETGRSVCQRQRDVIMRVLHQVCIKKGHDPEVRMGSLLLAMSYVMEQVQALVHNYRMITFFDVMKCDSVLVDLFNH